MPPKKKFEKTLGETLVPHGLTLPLQNITEKQIMVFNTLVYSDKELQSGFSKKAWPFF